MTYKNPLVAKKHPYNHYGDPFVFRYQGIYYLFVSTPRHESHIRCYKSIDLVNWDYVGKAADEPLLTAAYAPEIIYAYNKFYLITSPKGNGHYIYTSDRPEGPYKRLTNNIHSMIDGSFFVGSDAKLHLLRADHAGIAMLDVSEEGTLSNRRNLDTYLNAWTEGPGLFYKDGYYYLTYCGNNLISKGYRVACAVSKRFDCDFKVSLNDPLIISTMYGFTAFGHNSNVLGPDLDSWYCIYHVHEEKDTDFKPRRFFVDRLNFSGRLVHLGISDFTHKVPARPDFETFEPLKDFILTDGLLFSRAVTDTRFTFETSFSGVDTSIIVGTKENDIHYVVTFGAQELTITETVNNLVSVRRLPLHFNFNYEHTVRIVNGDTYAELLIDNAPLTAVPVVSNVKIGFKNYSTIKYTALSKYAAGSSNLDYPAVIPGMLSVTMINRTSELTLCPTDEIYEKTLKEDKYMYIAGEKGKYSLFMYAKISDKVKLSINDKVVSLTKTPSEYDYTSYYLGDFDLGTKGTIVISLLEGAVTYKFINVSKYVPLEVQNNFIKVGQQLKPNLETDSYYLEKELMGSFDVSVTFKLETLKPYDVFGIILNSHQYSNKYFQARYPLLGYLVGFEGPLLIVDRFNYGKERIYDRPLDINPGVLYTLRATFNNGLFNVYVDDTLYISTTVSDVAALGGFGLYSSLGTNIKFGPLHYLKATRKEGRE